MPDGRKEMYKMTDFKDFMKQREKLNEKAKDITKGGYQNDERFWWPGRGPDGNGTHVVRFLPQASIESSPLTNFYYHKFNVGDKKFFARCPTSVGKKCPICAYLQPLWDGSKADKDLANKYGRKKKFHTNVLIVQDTVTPKNNGKVMIWRLGVKIRDKIVQAIQPPAELAKLIKSINPFDFIDGADFMVSIKTVSKMPNYDDSKFLDRAPLMDGDDAQIEVVYNQLHKLDEWDTSPDFDGDDKLLERFLKAIGGGYQMEPSGKLDDSVDGMDAFNETPLGDDPEGDDPDPFGEKYGADTPDPEEPKDVKHEQEAVKESAPEADPDPDDDDVAFFKNVRNKKK